jgi:hypothetical protein
MVDNIKMNLKEIGCKDVGWIQLSHDRDWWRALADAAMNFRIP